MKLRIDDIKIRPDRQRKDLGNLDELAESMKKYGLIQPIVVDDIDFLIAGERRLRAAIILGWDDIDVKRKSALTELEREEIELEENVRRKELSWQEAVAAKARIHELQQAMYGVAKSGKGKVEHSWSMRDTASLLGESVGATSQDISLSQMMKIAPELANEPSKKAALRKFRVIAERFALQELAKRSSVKEDTSVQLVNGLASDHIKTLDDASIDLVVTDPPWGIDIDKMATGGVGWIWHRDERGETFDDSMDMNEDDKSQFGVWKGPFGHPAFLSIIPDLARVMKAGAHLYVFCSMENFFVYAEELTSVGFTVRSRPLIWVKNKQTFTSVFWKIAGKHEICLFAHKGAASRVLNAPANDILAYDVPENRIHVTEKPVSMLRYLIELSSAEGDMVYDPFGGSFSTARAAKLSNRRCVSCELDKDIFVKASALLKVDANAPKNSKA